MGEVVLLEMNDVQRDPFLWVFFTFYDHKKNIFKGGKKMDGRSPII